MEFEALAEILAEQLSVDKESITPDTSIMDDLGADSLDLVEIIMAIEQDYDVEISDEDMENIHTVGDAYNYIKEKLQQ